MPPRAGTAITACSTVPAVAGQPEHRGGAGTPLLALPGLTDTWRAWTPVLGALEARHEVPA